ncbi:YdiU family protein [Verrucomicrobiaceae bacterium 5K15]|uniref:Protein nucleotidyltransferase YdiU n=2 Tax=Oceaniferula flava TaxID=2800421 RepID=A0AAE2V9I1_9BACT|nr:YdiU family protein [Oceaniferula flavus]MBK1855148.1 YdiU family protein [Oceaniferula flavus]MBM1136454.1 YdiU family protein [Oceaniferula flavus]
MSDSTIPFDNSYARLSDRFYVRQNPAQVPEPALVKVNHSLATELGIDPSWLESADGLGMLSGNQVPEGAEPLAQVYAGHQFGGYSPQLGDGRAILLGEVVDASGTRRDIQLKGSGRTAFSRGGDGKAALGPVLREYLLSEAMHALGVPTTRALAAVTTGETVLRQDGPLTGGIFTRVAASHIRVGTFQYFYAQQEIDAVRELADYSLSRHFPETSDDLEPYLSLFKRVLRSQAELIAQWMSLGFIHGVMNTDNTAISGETIDYGPCAFMDEFHPQCVFSSIDSGGRYAWGNQPNIGLWNLSRFAETLVPLIDRDQERAIEKVESALAEFPEYFAEQYTARFRAKFALPSDADDALIKSALGLLANQQVDFTLFFRRLTQVAAGAEVEPLAGLFSDQVQFVRWFDRWKETFDVSQLDSMRAANPVLIARNHRVEEAIQAGYRGDFAPFERLHRALQNPFSDQQEFADLEQPPSPEEKVRETFCGT